MYRGLQREVERINNEVIHFTQDLIRTPSPSLHEGDVAGKVENLMRDLDYDLVFTDDVGNIVGVIVGGDPEFTVVMNSHMDTVRPEQLDRWDGSPFGGEVGDGRIQGVGAADCKGGLASQIFAGHALASSQLPLRGNIVVAATVAEENGCSVGVRHLFENTLVQIGMEPKFVVLGEPTALKVCHGHDGWVAVDVEVTSPTEYTARNAGEHLFKTLCFHSDEEGCVGQRSIMVSEAPRVNATPDGYLSAIRVNRRLFPGEQAGDVLEWLEQTALKETREMSSVSLAVHVHEEEQQLYTGHRRRIQLATPPWSTNLMHPLVDRARESLLTAGCGWMPEMWKLDRLGMGTAGATITRDFGLPVIGYGPGEERMAHSGNESVGVHNLVDSVFGAAVLMHGLSGAPVFGWH